jgi:hypothetical protein
MMPVAIGGVLQSFYMRYASVQNFFYRDTDNSSASTAIPHSLLRKEEDNRQK